VPQVNTLPLSSLSVSIREAGLHVTRPRVAVLDVLQTSSAHLDADAVADAARARVHGLSTQAVYNNLHALTAAGLLRRINAGAGRALYEARVGDNHHHFVCRCCGAVDDVDCVVGTAPCMEPTALDGRLVEEAAVTFRGVCPACAAGRED
jgi:Fur family transcriptional regulator, stress-responsive regulator